MVENREGKYMQLRMEFQLNPVADEVSALTAVVRPILSGTLYSLKRDLVDQAGGYDAITLEMMARIYKPGDGDCGICFEYAVHDALLRGEPRVSERVNDALTRHCKMAGQSNPISILFGAEKTGALQLIDTAKEVLTNESALLTGIKGRPVYLKRHIDQVAAAFRREERRLELPQSISGLWKADLFLGFTDIDRWVGTTVKVNKSHLEPARGLRIGIVPAKEGGDDSIKKEGNLIVCPLPYDDDFMQVFYQGWGIVRQFFYADAKVPPEPYLSRPPERQVARYLEDRRKYPVKDVIDALIPLSQPELIETESRTPDVVFRRKEPFGIGSVVVPVAKVVNPRR